MSRQKRSIVAIKKIPRSYKGLKYGETDGIIVSKQCSKCLEMKMIEEYNKHKSSFAGVRTYCKDCASKSFKRWREDNKGREKVRRRKYYLNNREELIKYSRKYVEENAEEVAKWKREYRQKELSRHAERERERNEIKKLLPNRLTKEDRNEILKTFKDSCSLTGESEEIVMDHVIPISIGHGGTIRGNIIPLTSKLNNSKNAANIFEWYGKNKERFNLCQNRFDFLIKYLSSENGMTIDQYREYVNECFRNPRDLEELRRVYSE